MFVELFKIVTIALFRIANGQLVQVYVPTQDSIMMTSQSMISSKTTAQTWEIEEIGAEIHWDFALSNKESMVLKLLHFKIMQMDRLLQQDFSASKVLVIDSKQNGVFLKVMSLIWTQTFIFKHQTNFIIAKGLHQTSELVNNFKWLLSTNYRTNQM